MQKESVDMPLKQNIVPTKHPLRGASIMQKRS